MKAPRRHRFARALLPLAASTVLALTLPAFAAEEWPPRTPPRVPSDGAPPVEAPPPVVAPPPVAAPPPVVEAPAPSTSVEIVRVAPPPARVDGPAYGLTGNRAFVRTPGDEIVLFPGGVVQVDAHAFHTGNLDVPDTRLWLARARPELAGWLGRAVYFNAAVDLAAGASLRGVDDFLAVAPFGERAILQVGQFDAPFTLENQTRDRALDFMDRSMVARAFAVPENKKRGAMLHGTNPDHNYYYAAGGFAGDGESDVMARAWVAPFSFDQPEILRDVTVGGSAWVGSATARASLAPQRTAGGVVLLEPSTVWLDGSTTTDVSLRPRGRLEAAALELNAPIRHRFGVRFEWAAKHEPLVELSATNGGAAATHGGFSLGGWAAYAEGWWWILGDDRFLGTPGLELPVRLTRPFGLREPLTGLMIAARLERLDETLTAPSGVMAPTDVWSVGRTTATTAAFDVNGWLGERVRVTASYAWNRVGGTTLYSTSFSDRDIHELALRLSLAL